MGLFLFSLDRKKEPKKDQVCSSESEKVQNSLKYKNSLALRQFVLLHGYFTLFLFRLSGNDGRDSFSFTR